ncbi:hypothetical protein BKA62DRAFT_629033 [Auriculariales sp. MPI-PUGE-AT-0066]|nr:hypothetical protein BKA62DRAFT_629033 [Auriculariales sp. MPI-PUGE-AT-0066]
MHVADVALNLADVSCDILWPDSDGTVHDRCGHYVPTSFYDKLDCGNRFCVRSASHNPRCQPPNCQCDHDWDPDHGQKITARVPHACSDCFAYFAAAPNVR